jgi:hypothetical protein
MGWRTYTIDGRSLAIELLRTGNWTARCSDGPEEQGADLAATIRAALEPRPAVGLDAWERWIRDQASYITTGAARN